MLPLQGYKKHLRDFFYIFFTIQILNNNNSENKLIFWTEFLRIEQLCLFMIDFYFF
jgi:hypothetical protein